MGSWSGPRANLYPLTHPGLLLLDRHSALAGWVTRPGSSRPPRLPWDSGLLGCDGLGLGAWVEWARPLQAHLPLVPLKLAHLMLRGSPEGPVSRGHCWDSPSKGLLPLCWPEGPCSQKPGQTPQVQCVVAVPAPETEKESGKGEMYGEGMLPGGLAWAHLPFSPGLYSPVLGCHRAQHHLEGGSPSFPMLRGCCISWGQGSMSP